MIGTSIQAHYFIVASCLSCLAKVCQFFMPQSLARFLRGHRPRVRDELKATDHSKGMHDSNEHKMVALLNTTKEQETQLLILDSKETFQDHFLLMICRH